ncbi:4-alpha-glucanotransferase [Synechococcus sp. W70.1]|jgi:4-alpha-glucanotransferase|uniref:4-alpha-glucanotransferase n=1 Tax=unclassified Synechococcus TaxID=2626047 RepID=UPI0039C129C8
MRRGRLSGILLHPTSLPGSFGIGDLGPAAYRFVDFLVESGQRLWQVLPLGPTGWGNSPYMSFSAIAGNPLLISPELLVEAGWLEANAWEDLPQWPAIQAGDAERVDYGIVIPFKLGLLQRAWATFKEKASAADWEAFHAYCAEEADWLPDYALFMALKEVYGEQEWTQWPPALAQRDPLALQEARDRYADAVTRQMFWQYLFAQQWRSLREYAHQHQVQLIGDVPIYVAADSADVWANRELFQLDEEGRPLWVAGVPPDYFSPTGQRWGNPLYNWEVLKARGYDWWIRRIQAILKQVDYVRIDHFRGFESYWAIPSKAETAVEGEWQKGPGADFFQALADKLGEIPIIAEDLGGEITPEVVQLRDQFSLPGMKVLLFAFGAGPDNPHLPHSYERNFVVYTGTHDNNTIVGWFEDPDRPEWEKQNLLRYLGCQGSAGIHWDLIRLALASVADLAIIPLQDVMGLGAEARMNFPGRAENNWAWRYREEMLRPELAQRLAEMSVTYGRISPHDLEQRRAALAQERAAAAAPRSHSQAGSTQALAP